MLRLFSLLMLACVLVLSLPNSARAGYCVSDPGAMGKDIKWQTNPIHYKINMSTLSNYTTAHSSLPGTMATDLRAAIVAAFNTWQAATCADISFQDDGDTTSTDYTHGINGGQGENYILIYFANDQAHWMPAQNMGANLGLVAATYFTYDPNTGSLGDHRGHFQSATLMFNDIAYKFSTASTQMDMDFDLQVIATNAIGYLIGLATNPSNQMSVMSNLFSYGDITKRNLVQDDQDGIAFLYPKMPTPMGCTATMPMTPAQCVPMGHGGSSGSTGSAGSSGSGGTGGMSGLGTGGTGTQMGNSGCGCTLGGGGPLGGNDVLGVTILALLATLGACALRCRRD